MNITNALINLRDDLKKWTTNNLNKRIPFSDTNVTLNAGGMIAPNGDMYFADKKTWMSTWVENIDSNLAGVSYKFKSISAPSYYDFEDQSTSTSTYLENVVKWICTNYQGYYSHIFNFTAYPNSMGPAQLHIYATYEVSSDTGLPRFSTGVYWPLNNSDIVKFGTYEYEFYCYEMDIDYSIKTAMDSKTIKVLTQAEYDALTTKDSNTIYLTT